MRDFRDAKAMAKTLREALNAKSLALTTSESQELVARILGFRDWNVLAARIQSTDTPTTSVQANSPTSTEEKIPLVPCVTWSCSRTWFRGFSWRATKPDRPWNTLSPATGALSWSPREVA